MRASDKRPKISCEVCGEKDSSILTRAEGVIAELAEFTTLEDKYPFVECSTFADEIKGTGYAFQADWHFVDNVFYDNFYTTVYNESFNVSWAIGEMLDAIKYAKP